MSQNNVSDNGSDWCSDTTRRRLGSCKQHVFNAHKFNYVSFNGSIPPCGSNGYTNPNMEIICSSRNVLDLGVYMSVDLHL